MSLTLSIADVALQPEQLTAQLHAGDGSAFTARVLRGTDGAALGRYFDNLGPSVRGVYRPHPLNADHAAVLCDALDYGQLLPFVAIDGEDIDDGDIIGYFLVRIGLRNDDLLRYVDYGQSLLDEQCCTLAPCVADAWQERGLGSALFLHVTASLRRLGRRHLVLWGGVRGDNPRAQHFYRKFGFRHVGNFSAKCPDNLDMILDL